MVNLRTAERQALGTHFVTGPQDRKLVADLRGGHLTLPPHKRWQLPAEPTWTEDPFSDNNWQFQYHMLRWLDPLRRAGQNGNAQAAAAWERYARSWIEANPPGDSASRWAWIDMADGIRAMELCHGLCVMGEQDWLIRSLEQHRDWLSDPSHLKHGNHGLHQTLGLFVVSAVLEDQDGTDLAVSWLGDRLRQAWDEQGANEEGSLAYHRMNYLWWQEAMTRLDLEGVDRPEGAQRLQLAPEEMAHATSPLGRLARIGDTNAASIRDIDHAYADFVTSEGARGAAPAKTTAIYDRGYAYIRSGWGQDRPFDEETYLTAVFGAQDKIHGHVDGGSVTYCSQGVQWLHDSGRYYYGRHPMQDYMKSRAAHSLVVLPGCTADKSTPVELVRSEVTDDCTDLLLSDRSYDGVSITRRIVYLRHWDLTVVLDRVESEEPVQAEQRWHCGRDVSAIPLSIGFALTHEKKTFHVAALTDNQRPDVRHGQEKPMVGWTATGWRKSTSVDVGTVYDEGTDLVFGALLGTWTPPAVDLLRGQISAGVGVDAPISELIPSALLRSQDAAALAPVRRSRPSKLIASVQSIGADAIRVTADGPGTYFSYELYDGGSIVRRVPWISRAEQTFDTTGLGSPRVRVWNRTQPADVQKILLEVESSRWGLPSADPYQIIGPESRTLVLLETMFCDNEQNEEVLAQYFERFKLSLRSLLKQKVPADSELLVTIYMSSDKQEWIRRVRRILNFTSHSPRARYRICEYDHAPDGYPQRDHIDWLKNPNKQAPYRSQHFVDAHSDIRMSGYGRLIRAAIDDDDLMLDHQVTSLVEMAVAAEKEYPEDHLIALGPLRTLIGYVEDSGVRFEDVDMRRSMGGNRCLVVKDPGAVDLAPLSPWSLPEVMDLNQGAVAEKRGIRLSYVRGHRPGLLYMRWGSNLSAHSKSMHVLEKHSEFSIERVEDILEELQLDMPEQGALSFGLLAPDLRLSIRRSGDSISVVSNFDKLRIRGGQICFYLMSGARRVDVRGYSLEPRARFVGAPDPAHAVGFIRLNGEVVARVESGQV